jgi:hypothetical protein
MSNAVRSKGTRLQVETSEGSTVFATISEVRDINGPNLESDETEVTNQDSPGNFKEFKANLIDPGMVSGNINYIPTDASHIRMLADKISLTERNYKLAYPPDFTKFWLFRGYTKTFSTKSAPSGVLTADISVRIVTAPTPPA